ncbi:MAG: hypothetical protein LCH58_15890 [Bacteroidetes bacterium]|uniref:hypothetical protein n=1 Tax=Phnomibacter sp. TaxID=2836217 RepID=UPI002FDE792D|nr:hypothetical protein [Bacteroidota bacterium]
MPLITAEQKDVFIKVIADNSALYHLSSVDLVTLKKYTGFNEDASRAMLEYMQERGLISDYNDYRVELAYVVKIDLHDFIQSGGFTMREVLYDVQLKRMQLEIDKLLLDLKPDHLDTANKIAGVVSGTMSVFQAYLAGR